MRSARVHIMVGSTTDEKVIQASGMVDTLQEILGEDDVMGSVYSAHRNADELAEYVPDACLDGAQVFIAVAGMAAALPGAVAAASGMAKLVIAVPLDEHGIDSCLYMPPGVPVALAGVGTPGLKNAALIACQALATDDGTVRENLRNYLERTTKKTDHDIDPERLKKPKEA